MALRAPPLAWFCAAQWPDFTPPLTIPAVFMENITDSRLLEQITAETGAKVGGTLFSDALSGPDGPAGTYLAMMRHNIATLTAALKE